MAPTELVIIGNGFDIAVGLPSSFTAFKAFVAKCDPDVHDAIEDFLQVDGDWRDLEEAFSWFDGEGAMDEAGEHLVGYGADDWSDSYHHAPQQEAHRIADALTTGIRRRLVEWVSSLDATPVAGNWMMPTARDIPHLQFNYTSTLQRVFGIPDANVVHIHGRASGGGNLVLGHAVPPSGDRPLSAPLDNEEADVRMREAADILDDVIDSTSKRSSEVIADNIAFFKGLSDVAHVVVLGHSLAEVDHPYFEEVHRHVRPDALWRVSCWSDGDRARAEDLRQALEVSLDRWKVIGIDERLTQNR